MSKSAALAVRIVKSPFVRAYPPGNFYSPLPSLTDIPNGYARPSKDCPAIDLREPAQLALLDELAQFYPELPFPEQPAPRHRYHLANEWFAYCDAIVLCSMLRRYRPKRVVEVGSGFSSAAMLDTRDRFFPDGIHFTFLDPYPQRLHALLWSEDRASCRVLDKKVQDVELATFEALEANDILFIDSSHVIKLGSDVAWILFEILPRLASGVVVHFHDILWPFEYPQAWLRAGRAWNEAYVLRAFLQNNERFEILFFNDYMTTFHADRVRERMPLALAPGPFKLTRPASSLWIAKR